MRPYIFRWGRITARLKELLNWNQRPVLIGLKKMFSLYIIFRTIVEEFGLRDDIYSYSIILTVLCIPILVLLVLLTRLARFLRKMCAAKNWAKAELRWSLMLICTICQCTNRRANCIQALTHIAGQNVPLKLHCQAPRDLNMSALKTQPEGALSDTVTYQSELVPYATVLD